MLQKAFKCSYYLAKIVFFSLYKKLSCLSYKKKSVMSKGKTFLKFDTKSFLLKFTSFKHACSKIDFLFSCYSFIFHFPQTFLLLLFSSFNKSGSKAFFYFLSLKEKIYVLIALKKTSNFPCSFSRAFI